MKKFFMAAAAVITMTLGIQAQIPETLFMVGSASPAGWNITDPTPMTAQGNGVFVYNGPLYTGEMKCPVTNGKGTLNPNNDWEREYYMPVTSGTEIGKNGVANPTIYLSATGTPDDKWNVTAEGIYSLTIDTKALTISAEYKGEIPPAPEECFMLGAATDRWDSNDPATMTDLGDGKYEWTGNLSYSAEDKLFKFCTTKGAWDKVNFLVPAEVNYNGNVMQIAEGTYSLQKCSEGAGTLKDWFFGLTSESLNGRYTVTVDTKALTVTVAAAEVEKPNYDHLYMLGLVAGSFDSEKPLEMKKVGDGVFTWTGTLSYDTADDDNNHFNKQFKFCNKIAPWNEEVYLTPAVVEDATSYLEIEKGTYDLLASSEMWGNLKDWFFGLKDTFEDGSYAITVDTNTMKLTLSDDAAVEDIATDSASRTVTGVYNLQGQRVASPKGGMFIVRYSDGTAVKRVIR